jgi:uncharacterized protein YjcR
MEGTRLPFKAVAAELGIGRTTLHRWWKGHGWERPAPPPRRSGPDSPGWHFAAGRSPRRRGRPIRVDGIEAVRLLVVGTLLSQKEISRRTGVSQERVSAWIRARGWTRPAARPGRFGASRRVGVLAEGGDRRGRPYAVSVRREARVLWQDTLLPTSLIGARLGVHPATIARWSKEGTWERPPGRRGARQLRGFFGVLHPRPRVVAVGRPRIRLL